jgi:hypothetical protein
MTHRRTAARLGIGLALALAAAACGSGGGSAGGGGGAAGSGGSAGSGAATPAATTAGSTACVRNEQGTGCLPLAPESRRIDRAAPVFSRPTEITNPLLPVAQVAQALQLGTVDGRPFRAEVTLLPGTKAITWDGRQVPNRIHQYVAYAGGRILEVALTGTPRPTTGRSGTSARTSSTTRTAWSPTPTAPGSPARTDRRA